MRIARRLATGVGLSLVDEALQIFSSYGYLSGDGVETRLRDKRFIDLRRATALSCA